MKRRKFLEVGLFSPVLAKGSWRAAKSDHDNGQLADAQGLQLENGKLAFQLNPIDGSLVEIHNKSTDEVHQATGTTFVIDTDHGQLTPGASRLTKSAVTADHIELIFERSPFIIKVDYHLNPSWHFLQKTLSVKNLGAETALIEEVMTDRHRFTPGFLEAYAHDDGSDWKCPLNVFLRTEHGGLFIGVENPYFEMVIPGAWKATRVDLRYSPGWLLHPGETFVSEPSFLGVYKKEHVYFFKELQHFAYMKQEQIIMDWGEVWAMQNFLRAIQPLYELPYPGYYLRANCVDFFTELGAPHADNPTPFGEPAKFWPPHSQAKFEAPMAVAGKAYVDMIAKQGYLRSIDWGTIWLGNAGWCRESPNDYLEDLPESWPIQPNPYWLEVVDYAREKGLGLGVMDEGGARDYMKNEVKWKILDKNGKPIRGVIQQQGYMGRNCWANRAFAEWWVGIVSKAIEKYDVAMWGTDGGSIWWVPFDPPLECYARDHGHPVGECGFYAWRNIMWASAELRRRHPRCALRNAGGMHRGYPWVLRDWIEFHPYLDPVPMTKGGNATDNIRFQSWHAYNLRFIPAYKSSGGARTDDRYGMAYGWFSNLTRGDHGMGSLEPPWRVTDPGEQKDHVAFFHKWADWANRNVEYMRVRRDILGEPRISGLDGCAHCIRDSGFIFVFNPSAETRAASIPLNSWIGLTEGEAFSATEIYPADGRSYGNYQRGEEIVVAVNSHDVVGLELRPAQGQEVGNRPTIPSGMAVDKAFLSAEQVRQHLGERVPIPGDRG